MTPTQHSTMKTIQTLVRKLNVAMREGEKIGLKVTMGMQSKGGLGPAYVVVDPKLDARVNVFGKEAGE